MTENKGKIPRTAKMPRIKKPSYFKAGSLVYEDLGHSLTRSGHYYRCTLNCRGRCKVHNEQIPNETLEKAFARNITKLVITPVDAERILKKTLRENLVDVLFGIDEIYDAEENVFDSTLAVMKQDAKDLGRIQKKDIQTATEALTKMHQADYPTLLLGFILGTLRALANPEYEAELGRTFAFMSKRINLSSKGKIVSVEFELWAWYILNLINRYIPNYLENIRAKGLIIKNIDHKLLKLPVAEAALSFSMGNVKEAMNVNMNLMYQMVKLMRDGIQATVGNTDPKQAAAASLLFLEEMKNNPALAIIMQMGNAINLKIE